VDSPLTRWKSIGVITFYKSQKLCIIDQLKKVGIKSNCSASTVDVNTVDSFQGREKDIIVISCVRASSQAEENLVGGIGFITSLSRINVAVTRAKETHGNLWAFSSVAKGWDLAGFDQRC
jgi:superfamily I DNA and/or RNA helicase